MSSTIGNFVGVACVAIMFTQPRTVDRASADEIVAKKLTIKDAAGKDRIVLATTENGAPMLKMYNKDENLVCFMSETPDGGCAMSFFGRVQPKTVDGTTTTTTSDSSSCCISWNALTLLDPDAHFVWEVKSK